MKTELKRVLLLSDIIENNKYVVEDRAKYQNREHYDTFKQIRTAGHIVTPKYFGGTIHCDKSYRTQTYHCNHLHLVPENVLKQKKK